MKGKIGFILNVIIFIFEIIGLILCLLDGGFYNFIYFTVLSNVFAMIVSATYSMYYFKTKSIELPNWIRLLRYMTTNCLTLTFFIVMTVLVPMAIKDSLVDDLLIRGPQMFHHILCPIISFISFCIFEEGELTVKSIGLAIIPTIIYAIILTFLNIIKVVIGPYPFLEVYEQPVYASILWFIGIIIISSGLAWFILYVFQLNIYEKYMKKETETLV